MLLKKKTKQKNIEFGTMKPEELKYKLISRFWPSKIHLPFSTLLTKGIRLCPAVL